jgi:hypothetical protein
LYGKTLDYGVTFLPDQVLEVRAVGKQLFVLRKQAHCNAPFRKKAHAGGPNCID